MRALIGKIARFLVLLPLGAALLWFALANRHWVTVSFDPLAPDHPLGAARVPLFVAMLLALILGVLIGGIASWLGGAKWRMAARRQAAELHALRLETEALRARLEVGALTAERGAGRLGHRSGAA